VPLFGYNTLRVFATSSLVPHSFRQGDLFCSVHTVEDSFSWKETRGYPTCGSAASGTDTSAGLIVADLDEETLEDADLRTNKNEEIPVSIGSRLFA
jgi:hypothetical protein